MAQPIDTRTGLPAEPGDEAFVYGQPYEDKVARLLGEARYTLGRGQQIMKEPYRLGEEAAAAEQAKHVAAVGAPSKPGLRGLTDYYEQAAEPIGLASIAPPLRPLGALTAGLLVPGGVRKILAPQEDESRLGGAGQLGLAALSLLGLKGKTPSVAAGHAPVSTSFRPYGFKPQSLQALENPSTESTLAGLPESWKQFAKPGIVSREKKAAKVIHTAAGNKSRIGRMNQQAEAGYRNVPAETNPNLGLLPESGLGTITPVEWQKLGLRQVRQTTPSYPNPEAGWGEDLLANLSRLKIPARARAFATNTPLPE